MKEITYHGKILHIEDKYIEASEFLDPGLNTEFFLDVQLSREIHEENFDEAIEKMSPDEIVSTYITGLRKELALRGRKV